MSERALRVGVVMPSLNQARFIRQAIESVLAQTYLHLELFVVDGGSTDGTLDILESFGTQVRWVSRPDNGQSDAINRGLSVMDADIVSWLNSDDLLSPGAVDAVVEAFDAHPDAQFVYGRGWIIDEDGNIMQDAGVLPFDRWKLIHQRNFIQQPSCFFRKQILEQAGVVDETLHYIMDWELWIRFSRFPCLYLDRYLSANRTYATNKTESGGLRRWREIRTVVRRYTNVGWPPVLTLYLLEITIQKLRQHNWLRPFTVPLGIAFRRCMTAEMSGRHADGGIAPRFRFTAAVREGAGVVRVLVTPLSRYDRGRLGATSVRIRWESSTREQGEFALEESGLPQEVQLPVKNVAPSGLVHFRCRASARGTTIGPGAGLSQRRIVGFLDVIDSAPSGLRSAAPVSATTRVASQHA